MSRLVGYFGFPKTSKDVINLIAGVVGMGSVAIALSTVTYSLIGVMVGAVYMGWILERMGPGKRP